MDKLEKLKQDMVEVRAKRQEFMDDHMKPPTDDSDIPIIELKTPSDAVKLQKFNDEILAIYKAYVVEWQLTKDNKTL